MESDFHKFYEDEYSQLRVMTPSMRRRQREEDAREEEFRSSHAGQRAWARGAMFRSQHKILHKVFLSESNNE